MSIRNGTRTNSRETHSVISSDTDNKEVVDMAPYSGRAPAYVESPDLLIGT